MNRVQSALNILSKAWATNRDTLSENQSKSLLSLYGIPVNQDFLVNNEMELEKVLLQENLSYPLVMKLDSPDIIHKTEVGAVKLNIKDIDQAKRTYNQILSDASSAYPDALVNGVSVQTMITDTACECILGMNYDNQFGPVLMYGLGGIWVEVFQDVSLRLPPLSKQDIIDMLKGTKGYKLLQGFRNQPPLDVEAMSSIIMNLSILSIELEQYVREIDINPIFLFPKGKGAIAVDALVRTHENVKDFRKLSIQ